MQPDWVVEHHPLKHKVSKNIMCFIVNNGFLSLVEQIMELCCLSNLMIPLIHIFTKQVDFFLVKKKHKQYP